MTDTTLKDGFEWLLEEIYNNYDVLEKRVNEALEKHKRQQNQQRIRRQHHLAATVSSSSNSAEEKIDNTEGTQIVVATTTTTATAPNAKQRNNSSRKTITNEISNLEIINERYKQKRFLQNMIGPTDDLSTYSASIDSVKMKYPQIFEVSSTKIPKKTKSVQTDGIFAINGNIRSISKPIRIAQIVPLSTITRERSKRHYPILRKTDSV